MKSKPQKNPAAVSLGRKGGLAVSKDRAHMRRISKLAVKARWPKKKIKN